MFIFDHLKPFKNEIFESKIVKYPKGTDVLVEIVSSHMYDPEGGLQRG